MPLRIAPFLAAALFPAPLAGAELHCLGTGPGFMLVIDGGTARFDYLGDGVFDLEPAVTLPLDGVRRTDLRTHGGAVPLFLEEAACPIFGIELDYRVEIGIQTSEGLRPMFGCCREAD
ncbi:hypothetical protein P6F26_10150 [Roseibacterium sp. SDUM158017]|uniref:hypothetical protein n=1 Tax=Roseicyclus salinarum TaxID=3036773 RepID=UPI0024151A3F|nr:hypothetical protein [Roseibacterium sp. SDUM158017]MDG4648805.1 hypothetical protein [Roseibacterium sp. SDUM158017]